MKHTISLSFLFLTMMICSTNISADESEEIREYARLTPTEPDCIHPSYFIYFSHLSGEGTGPRYLITSKKAVYPQNGYDEYLFGYTTQIIVDSICIKSIKNFINDFEKIKFSESNQPRDGIYYNFYEVNNCIDSLIFYIPNTKYGIIFFNHLLKFLNENKFYFPELEDLIKAEIKSLKLYNDKIYKVK